MNTTLEQLIDWIYENDKFDYSLEAYDIVKKAKDLLENEKNQIIQAYQVGSINNYDKEKFPNLTPDYFEICAKEYFKKHYELNN